LGVFPFDVLSHEVDFFGVGIAGWIKRRYVAYTAKPCPARIFPGLLDEEKKF
jgi:hypothetical protein